MSEQNSDLFNKDLMNKSQYRDACRYRMRESLENLLEIWNRDQDEELATVENIKQSISILENRIEELKYFEEKIETTGEHGPYNSDFRAN